MAHIEIYPLNKICDQNLLDRSIIIGKWGNTLPIISSGNRLIRLHQPKKVNNSTYNWYSNWKDLTPHKKYTNTIILEKELNIKNINKDALEIWKQWGISGSSHPSSKWLTKINKLTAKRQKNKHGLDTNMYQGIVPLPQEVYTLYENRPNRTIAVFDIKSAYPSTIANILMPDPATLQYIDKEHIKELWKNDTYSGLFRVILELKESTPEWFKEWHPLVLNQNMQSYKFRFPDNTPIITWMHSNEIEAWSPFLNITPIDGIVGLKHTHPMASIVHQLLNKRNKSNSKLEEAQLKWLLSRVHSASTMKVLKYANHTDASAWFDLIGSCPRHKHNHIPLKNNSWYIPDIDNVHNIYTWNAAITCYLRGYWLSFLTSIMNTNKEALLCYANIDSMHISFNSNTLDETLNELTKQEYIGNIPGKWELTHTAQQGLWLSTDKYWLVKDDTIAKTITDGEKWKLKDTKHMIQDGYLKLWKRSLWHSISSSKNTKSITKKLILQKRRTLKVILNLSEFKKQWNRETLKSRNWKKRLWYKTRKTIL